MDNTELRSEVHRLMDAIMDHAKVSSELINLIGGLTEQLESMDEDK